MVITHDRTLGGGQSAAWVALPLSRIGRRACVAHQSSDHILLDGGLELAGLTPVVSGCVP